MIDIRRTLFALMVATIATAALAQDRPGRGDDHSNRGGQSQQGGTGREQNGPGVLSLLPGDAVTEHSVDL
ncbi:MAG TPA: hypothetical protein VG271_12055, partial [Beijerinckiaceae bacterium]|nr:hypothetical protein [Beijerinckiaceae bacterium]